MKKATNNIIGSLIATAVLSVAVGYGVSFWEHWRTTQSALSRFSSSPNSTRPISEKPGSFEPTILEAPSKLIFAEEES